MSAFYEVLPVMKDENGETSIAASFTARSGIRVGIIDDGDDCWREFDFTDEQAELVGHALVRWAQRNRVGSAPPKNAVGSMRPNPPGCVTPPHTQTWWQAYDPLHRQRRWRRKMTSADRREHPFKYGEYVTILRTGETGRLADVFCAHDGTTILIKTPFGDRHVDMPIGAKAGEFIAR